MIATSRYFFLLVTSQLISLCLLAQMMDDTNGTKIFKPEFRRLINHEAIDREQSNLLASDGRNAARRVIPHAKLKRRSRKS